MVVCCRQNQWSCPFLKKKKDILSNIYGSDKKNILRTVYSTSKHLTSIKCLYSTCTCNINKLLNVNEHFDKTYSYNHSFKLYSIKVMLPYLCNPHVLFHCQEHVLVVLYSLVMQLNEAAGQTEFPSAKNSATFCFANWKLYQIIIKILH